MILLSARIKVMKTNVVPFDRPNNRFGLHCHPLICPMVETRPMLLEEHRCALSCRVAPN